jgi:hypothetical protein
MAAEPPRKRWTGAHPVGFDSSTLCHTPECSWESSQIPNLAHSVRITAPVPFLKRARRTASHRTANAARAGNGATGFDSQALCHGQQADKDGRACL